MVKNLPTVERSTKIRFGKYALDDQAENTIVFNASNVAINANTPGSMYMTPLRSEDIRIPDVKILTYNRITKEILDSNVTSDDMFTLNLEDITIQGNVTSNTIQFVNEATAFVTLANVGIANTNPTHALDIGSKFHVTEGGEVRIGPSVLIDSNADNNIQVSGRINTDSITVDHIGLSNTNPTITGLSLGSNTFLQHPTASINAFSTTGNVSAAFYHGDSYFLSNLNLDNIILQGNTAASKTVEFNKSGTSLITASNVGIANALPVHTLDVGSNLFVDDKGSNVLVVTGNTFTSRKVLIGSNVTIDTLGSNVVEITGNTFTSRKALIGSNVTIDTLGSNVVEVTGNTFTSRKALVGSNLVMDTLGSNVVEVTGNTFTSRKVLVGSNVTIDTLGSNVVEVTGNTFTSRKALIGSNVTIDTLGSNVVEVTGNTFTSRKVLVGSNVTIDTLGSNVLEVTGNTFTSRKALIGSNVIIDTLGTDVVEVTGNVNVSNYTKTDYITVQKDAHIKGNLLVEGTTTTIDTTNTTFEDAVISLANNNELATTDIGIIMKQPGSNANPTVTFRGDEKELMIGYTLNNSLDTEITPDLANVIDLHVYGNVIAQNNITLTSGELTAITLNGNVIGNNVDVITLNGNVIGNNVDVITLNGNVIGNNVDVITLYGNVSGDNVSAITLYGNVSGDNVSAITLYGNVSGDNVSVITLNGNVVADNIYGSIYGSNTISASAIYVGTGTPPNLNGLRVEGDTEITGNLLVGGTTTTVNTQNLIVQDPIIQLGDASASVDSGLLLARLSDTDNVYVGYDQSESEFAIGFTSNHAGESSITVKDGVNFTLNVHGNVEASYFFGDGSQLSGIQTATPNLHDVVNVDNVTSNVVQFSNATTGIEVTSNIDFVNKITLKSTSETKSNLFVVNAIQLDPDYAEPTRNVLSYDTTTGEIYDSGGQGGGGSSFVNITEEAANVLIGSNLTINSFGSNVLTVSGNVSADNITIGGLNIAASPFALDDVVSVYEGANVTANVLTLGGLVTSGNVDAGNITISGNTTSQNIKLTNTDISATISSGTITIDAKEKSYGTAPLVVSTTDVSNLIFSNLITGAQIVVPILASGGAINISSAMTNVNFYAMTTDVSVTQDKHALMTLSNLYGNIYMNAIGFA
jgi:hypothetical protein